MPTIRCFASHDWGKDASNHNKVKVVVQKLKERGIDVWFDETHMKGNILTSMCKGIDSSDVVLVFVTENYISKVQNGGDKDNVRREFMYTADNCPEKLLSIRFEEHLPSKWVGPVGMVLGSTLYVDMCSVDNESIDSLVHSVRRKTAKTLWKACTNKVNISFTTPPPTHRLPPPRSRPPPPLRPPSKEEQRESMFSRVEEALHIMGKRMEDGEHTTKALDRLIDSVVGENAPVKKEPFFKKLEAVEKELGLEKK